MGHRPHSFEPSALLPWSQGLPSGGTCWVAYSGGPDSSALLLALASLRPQLPMQLAAVHVEHGVHADAGLWAEHCARACQRLDLPFRHLPPPASPLPKDSPEAQLRRWRYDAMKTLLEAGDVVCTAHHREDQAETLLLNLMRGSGPAGLAAMPHARPLGRGQLLRPLLNFSRASLHHWLEQQGATYLQDPSNLRTDADRNYLRHEILPRLRARWPATDRALAQSAAHCASSEKLLQQDMLQLLGQQTPAPGILKVPSASLDQDRLLLLLRSWLRSLHAAPAPRRQLLSLCAQLATRGDDDRIAMHWAGHELLHHRGLLWFDPAKAEPVPAQAPWDGRPTAALTASHGRMELIGAERLKAPLSLGPRQAGDRFQRLADGPHMQLKDWFRERGLPPWQRDGLPVLRSGKRILAVGDELLYQPFADQLAACDAQLHWSPKDEGMAWAWKHAAAPRTR